MCRLHFPTARRGATRVEAHPKQVMNSRIDIDRSTARNATRKQRTLRALGAAVAGGAVVWLLLNAFVVLVTRD